MNRAATMSEAVRGYECNKRHKGVIIRQIWSNSLMNTISPVYARLVLREFERREIDPAPLFSGIALSRDELVRGGDISMDAFLHILRTGHRLMADEQLGLMLGRSMHVFAMGPLGSGMAMAPSLREGLQLLESFTRLHASYIEISVRSTLRGLTATIHYQHDTGELEGLHLSLIHISEPTRLDLASRMPSSA